MSEARKRPRHFDNYLKWTDEEKAYAIRRRQEGATAPQIASEFQKVFGYSRSKHMLASFFRREEIPLPENLSQAQIYAMRSVAGGAKARAEKKDKIKEPPQERAKRTLSTFDQRALIPLEMVRSNITAMARVEKPATCQWPIGIPGAPSFHFCNCAVKTGKPYCADHCSMAYASKVA
jgi:hypothetical protein